MNATERALQHCLDGNDMRGIGPWPRYIVFHERLWRQNVGRSPASRGAIMHTKVSR